MSNTHEITNFHNLAPAFVIFADQLTPSHLLPDERMAWLRDVINLHAERVGAHIKLVQVARETPTPDVLTRPAGRGDFEDFAVRSGFTAARARRAWGSASYVIADQHAATYNSYTALVDDAWEVTVRPPTDSAIPRLRSAKGLLDLDSVRERLEATEYDPSAWVKATHPTVDFLVRISEV